MQHSRLDQTTVEGEFISGSWLEQKGRAADLVISTKVGFPYGDVPRSLKKEIILSECELSLRWLGVECIDLYFAHAYDSETPIEESMEAFYQLAATTHLPGTFHQPDLRRYGSP